MAEIGQTSLFGDGLVQEKRTFQEQVDQEAHAYPEMVPLLVIRVEGGGHE